MMITTLPDDTTVWVKWSNENPNNPGGQHTNGPPTCWVRFSGSPEWHGFRTYESTIKVRLAIQNALTKQDVLDLLDIKES